MPDEYKKNSQGCCKVKMVFKPFEKPESRVAIFPGDFSEADFFLNLKNSIKVIAKVNKIRVFWSVTNELTGFNM
jgi:hypothetical protein